MSRLASPNPGAVQPEIRRRRRGRVLAAGVIVALILLAAGRLYVAQRELRAGVAEVALTLDHVRAAGAQSRAAAMLDEAPRLAEACRRLRRGHAMAEPWPWLMQPLRAVPSLRGWGHGETLLQASDSLCDVRMDAERLGDTLAPGLRGPEPAPALLAALHGARPELAALARHAGQAAADLSLAQPGDFTGPLAPVDSRLEELRALVPLLEALRDSAPRAPELAGRLLGEDAARTYLVLAQDNAEPRATGGFVGVMGPLTIAGGRIGRAEFRSSYDWDNPSLPPLAPPQPLALYMNVGAWYLRDANWSPDFGQSAAAVESMWQASQGERVDGVVAVDLPALDDMLTAVGGVDVPELGGFVTAGSAEQRIEERRNTPQVLASYDNYQRAKTELLGALYRAVLAKLKQPDAGRLPLIVSALLHDLETKHIMLSLSDPDLAALARWRSWDGRIVPAPGDALGIVDTSVSYGKVGPYLRKNAVYRRDDRGNVALTITYSNSFRPTPAAPWDPYISGLYWDWRTRDFVKEQGNWLGYIRVLLPAGVELRGSGGWDGVPTVSHDLPGFDVIAAPVLVRPGASRELRLSYQLPGEAAHAPLRVIAQPGAAAYSLHVESQGLPEQALTVDGQDQVALIGSYGQVA